MSRMKSCPGSRAAVSALGGLLVLGGVALGIGATLKSLWLLYLPNPPTLANRRLGAAANGWGSGNACLKGARCGAGGADHPQNLLPALSRPGGPRHVALSSLCRDGGQEGCAEEYRQSFHGTG